MNPNYFEGISNFLNKIPRINISVIIGIWIFSGLVLFIPTDILKTPEFTKFKSNYGEYVILAFGITSIWLLIGFINLIRKYIDDKKIEKNFRKKIQDLDPVEKLVLREFFIRKRNTLKLPVEYSSISGLIDKEILYYTSDAVKKPLGADSAYMDCSITDLAKKFLNNENWESYLLDESVSNKTKTPDWLRGLPK